MHVAGGWGMGLSGLLTLPHLPLPPSLHWPRKVCVYGDVGAGEDATQWPGGQDWGWAPVAMETETLLALVPPSPTHPGHRPLGNDS